MPGMLGKTYEGQDCSAARTLELVGERWSLLIIRDALFAGMTRFSEFQRSLGVAPNVLAARLAWFVEAGLMTLEPVSERSEPSEYRLTEKGTELAPVVVALTAWGERWVDPIGPIVYKHRECGGFVSQVVTCASCGEEVQPADVVVELRSPRRSRPSARRH
jgi:DNA-binding HxlR family transcriptional regulator